MICQTYRRKYIKQGGEVTQVKRKAMRVIYSGSVLEKEIYTVAEKTKDIKKAKPRLRFTTEEEREAHKQGISKRKHARSFNENFSPTSIYSTLTFDDENEVHTMKEARYIRSLYLRRLRYACPDAVIYFYIGRGKSTHRIHFHMVSEGIPKKIIRKQWIYGEIVEMKNLREHNYYQGIDHGQDYTGLANYLWEHWTPEVGGKRWYQTRNARKPEKDKPKEVKRLYTEMKPPAVPKGYKYVDCKCTKYGYWCFKYVKEPPPDERRRGKKKKDTS